MAHGYKNIHPDGDRTAHELLPLCQDMITSIERKVAASGEDMLIVICNLQDKIGLALAQLNADFVQTADNDLWAFALKKSEYNSLMTKAGSTDTSLMRPWAKQIVIWTNGISHYFSLPGKYSGIPDGSHWGQFRKRDLQS